MMRGLGPHTQQDYIRPVRRRAAFLGRPPDTATEEDLRRFQIHQHEAGVSVPTINGTGAQPGRHASGARGAQRGGSRAAALGGTGHQVQGGPWYGVWRGPERMPVEAGTGLRLKDERRSASCLPDWDTAFLMVRRYDSNILPCFVCFSYSCLIAQ